MDAWTAYAFTCGAIIGALVTRILVQYRVVRD